MIFIEIISWVVFVVLVIIVWGFVFWAWREALIDGGHIRR